MSSVWLKSSIKIYVFYWRRWKWIAISHIGIWILVLLIPSWSYLSICNVNSRVPLYMWISEREKVIKSNVGNVRNFGFISFGCLSWPPYFYRILKIPQELDQSNFPTQNYTSGSNHNDNVGPITNDLNRINNRKGNNRKSEGQANKSNLHTVSLTSADNGGDARGAPVNNGGNVGNPYSSWPEGNEENEENEDADIDGTINVSVDR